MPLVRSKRRRLAKGPSATSSALSTIGGTLGGLTGIPGASSVGTWAGNAISKFMGWGDYAIGVNSLINPDGGINISKGVEASNVRIRHSEFLGDITVQATGTPFTLAFDQIVNPGNRALFPWLSQLAENYEQWIPKGIVFEFKSTASTNSNSTNLGSVAIASDYDVYDDAPTSRVQMLQMAFAQDNSVAANQAHGLECDPRQNPNGMFWILHKGEAIEGSAREYHLCRTYLSAGNANTSGIVGQLWVHYDIVLCKERAPKNQDYDYDQWKITSTSGNVWADTSIFGLASSALVYNHTPQNDASLVGNRYTFPSTVRVGQTYLFMARWQGAANGASIRFEGFFGSGCELGAAPASQIDELWRGDAAASSGYSIPYLNAALAAGNPAYLVLLIRITSTTAVPYFQLSGPNVLPTSGAAQNITITVVRILEDGN